MNFQLNKLATRHAYGPPRKPKLNSPQLGFGTRAPQPLAKGATQKVGLNPHWPAYPYGFRPPWCYSTSSNLRRPCSATTHNRPISQDPFLQRYSLRSTRPKSSSSTGVVKDCNISRWPPPTSFGSRSVTPLSWPVGAPQDQSSSTVATRFRPGSAPSAFRADQSTPPRGRFFGYPVTRPGSPAVSVRVQSPVLIRYPRAILSTPRMPRPETPATPEPVTVEHDRKHSSDMLSL